MNDHRSSAATTSPGGAGTSSKRGSRNAALVIAGAVATVLAGAAFARERPRLTQAQQEDANTRMVLAMWRGVIEQADARAAMRYIARDYVQHNPNVLPGRAGVLKLIEIIRNTPPGVHKPAKKVLLHAMAKGDRVILIWNQQQPDPVAQGETYTGQAFDMFRIANGKIVEHWDDTRKLVRPWH